MFSATYSPEDNKLRLYSLHRFDDETKRKIKSAGYRWAPKQELWFTTWTPKAEAIAYELAGDIDDEDTSLVERAEQRAERFEEYSDNRRNDAESAKAEVDRIADGIPFGQPILVGHHSERRARKDAEKIQNGMRKAVRMWETSEYWQRRAEGAKRNAKYKERNDVRWRRIKKLESEVRSWSAQFTKCEKSKPDVCSEGITRFWCSPRGGRGGSWKTQEQIDATRKHYEPWIAHNERRIAYERAMLDESGGLVADQYDIQIGGRVKIKTFGKTIWVNVLRVNKSNGMISSVSTDNKNWPRVVSYPDILEYEPPTTEAKQAVKAKTKLPPLTNYQPGGRLEMTNAEWKRIHRDYKTTRVIEDDGTHGKHRVRYSMKKATLQPVYITDMKEKQPPKSTAEIAPKLADPGVSHVDQLKDAERRNAAQKPNDDDFGDVMRDVKNLLSSGGLVETVVADQLFETPQWLVEKMVGIAGSRHTFTFLEPSAGTGRIVDELLRRRESVTCYEINPKLAEGLKAKSTAANYKAHCADFLKVDAPTDFWKYHRILMNPPFKNGSDIKHIKHALTFLKPGGMLVAICANGPRQNEQLKPLADTWEELPDDTFRGTSVRAVLLTIKGDRHV